MNSIWVRLIQSLLWIITEGLSCQGDDKSLRVWEFGIPVVIKYISEPHMHSMPAVSVHPSGNWLAAQSLNTQILIYGTRERFQLNKKKRFAGHIVAGFGTGRAVTSSGHLNVTMEYALEVNGILWNRVKSVLVVGTA
uniref:BCAS3 domain-containing protein n=1 Tax=Brassica oleracea TaxID=3712 RepID=A0A3P6G6A2_BRAOL|nr:unnamed protein product [Brassica oleracea]